MREKREELEREIEARLAASFPEVELVDFEVRGQGTPVLTLFIDRPGGVDLDLCAAVNLGLESLRERYALEVSSPGWTGGCASPSTSLRSSAERSPSTCVSPSRVAATSAACSRRPVRIPSPSRSTTEAASHCRSAVWARRTWSTTIRLTGETEANVSREIIEALRQIESEKGIAFEALVEALEDALLSAYKKSPDAAEYATVEIDTETGDMRVFQLIFPEHIDTEALKVHDERRARRSDSTSAASTMSEVERIEVTPDDFGRIAAMTAKQVILQRIREAERDLMYDEYIDRIGELVTGIVQQSDPRHNTLVELGRVEAELPRGEQIETEHYEHGARIKAVIIRVEESAKGPQVKLSRRSEELVRKLFELEVPEIADGLVEIRQVARETGYRGGSRGPLQDRGGLARRRCRPGRRLRGPARLARAHGGQRAARRAHRHHPVQRRPRPVRRQGALAGAGA